MTEVNFGLRRKPGVLDAKAWIVWEVPMAIRLVLKALATIGESMRITMLPPRRNAL
jgi:hypothetical protein